MNKKRVYQISQEVKKSLSDIIQNKVKDPRIPEIISVSHVEVTNDLSFAKVHISIFSTDVEMDEVLEGLNNAKGFIKKELSKSVKLRAMPDLIFIGDESIELGIKMAKLIDEVNNGDK
ncbi:30S ribosome-binding factor RbfA [Anaerosphaera multitolerans]|uniref:Ribosome-binding factor A n=1 Tax=Anaerosphaera multitolerans TaxID=2487351 RepID=A0A437S582_9FIRM|nr:30S ribosome-binding factor RbfA [Anaerosphaera multitolerans]RVU54173.1 30S ribosome-binding factor RbfA [Anaerosphaera multitolerans]